LKEGTYFYNIVIPKLDKLKQQIWDISAQLRIEHLK
jgi:hypothetical protein